MLKFEVKDSFYPYKLVFSIGGILEIFYALAVYCTEYQERLQPKYSFSGDRFFTVFIGFLLVFLLIHGVLTIFWSTFLSKPFRTILTTVLIDEKQIQFIYKRNGKIVRIEQIKKDEIEEFKVTYSWRLLINLKKIDGTELVILDRIAQYGIGYSVGWINKDMLAFRNFLLNNYKEIPKLKYTDEDILFDRLYVTPDEIRPPTSSKLYGTIIFFIIGSFIIGMLFLLIYSYI